MNATTPCPKCGQPAEECVEEVDVGVGTQRHVWGCECRNCGQLSVYSCCGNWDFQGHAAWCNEATGN